MFDFDLYEVSLSELTPLNTEVITMSAIDQDQDDVISYAIIDNNNDNTFDILPNGKVYLVDRLDRWVFFKKTKHGAKKFAREYSPSKKSGYFFGFFSGYFFTTEWEMGKIEFHSSGVVYY